MKIDNTLKSMFIVGVVWLMIGAIRKYSEIEPMRMIIGGLAMVVISTILTYVKVKHFE